MKRIKHYTIDVVPHSRQAYETVGDYGEKKDRLWVKVSDLNNETRELAIGIHELIEQHLCKLAGVSIKSINAFDLQYEKGRKMGGVSLCGCLIGKYDEPGMDPHCPYGPQHVFATVLEKQLIGEAAWAIYDKKVNKLSQ